MGAKVAIFKKRIIVCFGGKPGCGKDEHGDRFGDFLYKNSSGLSVMSYDNGDGLRKATKNPEFTDYMKNILHESIYVKGETVPGMITISGLKEFVFKTNTGNEDYVFKGLFRTPCEPDLFVKLTDKYFPGAPKYFIRLNISDDVARERLGKRIDKTGIKRIDDENEKTKDERLKAYLDTDLIYDKIADSGIFTFFNINGERPIPEVQEEIRSKILNTL